MRCVEEQEKVIQRNEARAGWLTGRSTHPIIISSPQHSDSTTHTLSLAAHLSTYALFLSPPSSFSACQRERRQGEYKVAEGSVKAFHTIITTTRIPFRVNSPFIQIYLVNAEFSLCPPHYHYLLRLSLFLPHLIPNCVALNVCGMEGWLTEELSTDY